MRSLTDLYALYSALGAEASAKHGRWKELAEVYDGSLLIPDVERDSVAASAAPNLINQGIDAYARRAASTQPQVDSPPMRANIASSRRQAEKRGRVIRGWWQGSGMSVADYQRYRYDFGYGAAPVIIRGHPDHPAIPRWSILNPHNVLTGPKELDYLPGVPYAFVTSRRSVKWVLDYFGVTFGKRRPDEMVEVVEYNDAEQVTIFCIGGTGPSMPQWNHGAGLTPWGYDGSSMLYGQELRHRVIERISGPSEKMDGAWLVELSSTPNFANICLVSYPGAISLSRVCGIGDAILSKHKLHAWLLDAYMRGVVKGIWPDTWAVFGEDSNGQIVTHANGRRDIVGEIRGGTIITEQIQPGYQAIGLIDRIEAYERNDGGVISEFGGTSGTNIRTRARGEAVAAEVVDPLVREAHERMQVAREHENALAVAHAKGYGGSRSFSLYVTTGNTKKAEQYVPNELFETSQTVVRYPVAGVDKSGAIIVAGQKLSLELISRRTARVMDPDIEDVDAEETLLRVQALEGVVLAQLAEAVATSPEDAAEALRLTRQGMAMEEVMSTLQRRAQERQATEGAVGEPTGPAAPGSPEAQPGLGVPGGPAAVPEAVPEGPASVRNLAMMMQNMRAPTRTVPAERSA